MALELAPNGITVRATQSKEFYEGNQRHILNEKEYYVVLSTRDFFETKTNILENDHKIVPDLSHIVTTFVETMNLAFCGRKDLNDDISNWDTSNVRSMSWMFQGAYNFNQDISAWDTSNVESMYQMFMGAKKFNQDLSKWDIRSVQNMDHMFAYAKSFIYDMETAWKPTMREECRPIDLMKQTLFDYYKLRRARTIEVVSAIKGELIATAWKEPRVID